MYAHIGMSLCCTPVTVDVEARAQLLVFPSINLTLSFSDRSFISEAGACGFSSTLSNECEKRTMLMYTVAVPSMATCTASNTIHVGAADLISGPPVCATTALSIQSPPQS